MHSSCYPLSDNGDPSPYTPLACLKCLPSRHINRLLQSTPHGQRAHKCAKWTVSHTAKGLTPPDDKVEEGRGEGKDIGQTGRQIGEQPTQLDSVNVRFVWHFSYEYELLAVVLSAPVSHTVHLSPSHSHSLLLSLSVRVCTRHAAYMCTCVYINCIIFTHFCRRRAQP